MKRLGIIVFILTILFALSGCNTGEGSSSSVSSGGVEVDSAGQRAEAVVRSILTCPNEFLKENIQRMTVVVDAAGKGAVEGQSEAEATQEEYEEFLKGLYAQEDFTVLCQAAGATVFHQRVWNALRQKGDFPDSGNRDGSAHRRGRPCLFGNRSGKDSEGR